MELIPAQEARLIRDTGNIASFIQVVNFLVNKGELDAFTVRCSPFRDTTFAKTPELIETGVKTATAKSLLEAAGYQVTMQKANSLLVEF